MPATRRISELGLRGNIVCTTTGLPSAPTVAAISCAAASSSSWTPPGWVEYPPK